MAEKSSSVPKKAHTASDSGARPVAEDAILSAAFELLQENGLRATTVEAIARRAGVSKVTIYKWWPNRSAVIMSAFLREVTTMLPYPTKVEPRDIRSRLLQMAHEFRGSTGALIRALVAEGEIDPEIADAFREGYLRPRRVEGIELIAAAIADGQIRKSDPKVVLDLLYGPLYFRLLVGHEPLTDNFVKAHVDLVWRGLAVQ